ncbi:hypothetical protein B0H14DRAFT_3143135 [Mycena olivaceomarginata]|nr:hypothetical protein B0H14DRAFT_3143135 [Mycena olivaceomarginata]
MPSILVLLFVFSRPAAGPSALQTRLEFDRVLRVPEYLSDEFSGPESDSETPEDWKFRLETLANFRNDPTSLKATHILEVLVPGWRDEQSSFTPFKTVTRRGVRVTPSSTIACRVSTRIPRYAPHNSGVKQDWLEDTKNNPDLALQITGWGNYNEPAGCEFKPIPLPT